MVGHPVGDGALLTKNRDGLLTLIGIGTSETQYLMVFKRSVWKYETNVCKLIIHSVESLGCQTTRKSFLPRTKKMVGLDFVEANVDEGNTIC